MKLVFSVDGKKLSADCGLKKLRVKSFSGDYEVLFGPPEKYFFSAGAVVCDAKVKKLHPSRFPKKIRALELEAGERLKTFSGAGKIFDFLRLKAVARSGSLSVVGGGTFHDCAGFCAACYKRGIRWEYSPTTLLAMFDCCLGGKTAINYAGAKNQLGFFYPPRRVFVDPVFSSTLEPEQKASGLGEALKTAVIAGPAALEKYRALSPRVMAGDSAAVLEMARLCLSVKKAVVEADERETGLRRVLNYGHTVCHAVESLCGWRIPHGICVAIGMTAAAEISGVSGDWRAEVDGLCLEIIGKRKLPQFAASALLAALGEDKKAAAGSAAFVFALSPGNMIVKPVALNRNLGLRLSRFLSIF